MMELDLMSSYAGRLRMIAFVIFILSNASVKSLDKRGNVVIDNLNQSFWESRFSCYIPILKMLKRHIRWIDNKTVAVTLVYQAKEPVDTRWFLGDDNRQRLKNSEVAFKLPVDGDPNCDLKFMKSGQVTAATLTIRQFHQRSAHNLETILTTRNGTVQYQLLTVIRSRTGSGKSTPETIESPEWLLVPEPEVEYRRRGPLVISCAVFVPKESSFFTNELTMSRVPLTSDGPQKAYIDKVVTIHKDTQDVIEGDKEVLYVGKRYETKHRHVIYHVGLSSRNSSLDFTGIYQCSLERAHDRLYIRFFVLQSPTLTFRTVIELISCEEKNYDKIRGNLTLTAGEATCFRCRATGRPRPSVAVYRNKDELLPTPEIGVTKYISVMDEGASEVTYTYHNPIPRVDDGTYFCEASNSGHLAARIRFNIAVIQKSHRKLS